MKASFLLIAVVCYVISAASAVAENAKPSDAIKGVLVPQMPTAAPAVIPTPSENALPNNGPANITSPTPTLPSSPPQPIVSTIDLPVDGYIAPGIIKAIQVNDRSVIPDSKEARHYIASILKGITDTCGERSSSVAMATAGYVNPDLARGMSGDASVGLDMMAKLLKGAAGGPGGLMGAMQSFVFLVKEGIEDGRLFVSSNGCVSTDYRAFEANIESLIVARSGTAMAEHDAILWSRLLSPDFRRLNNIPDPDVALRDREIGEYSARAQRSCVGIYDNDQFCSCTVKAIKDLDATMDDWRTLAAAFDTITTTSLDKSTLRQKVRACDPT